MSRDNGWKCSLLCSVLVGAGSSVGLAQEFDAGVLDALRRPAFLDTGAGALAALSPEEQPPGGADSAEAADVADSAEAAPAAGEESKGPEAGRFLGEDWEGYEGGRGLITLEGVSGMFLNPTSGTLPARSLTAQYCIAILERNEHTDYQHTAMVSYGVTDWFELGALGRITDPTGDPAIGAGGPLGRIRLLRDRAWIPELSVGGMWRTGNERLDRITFFVAASKHIAFEENSFGLGGVRVHGGFRQIWQDSDVNEANGSIFYGGAEVEFPYDIWLVGEISNKTDVFDHQPYAFGLQWRPTQVLGLSVAGTQTGGDDQISLYIGIGGTLDL
jgi:hypothetical protein